jgi:hypothetical protein
MKYVHWLDRSLAGHMSKQETGVWPGGPIVSQSTTDGELGMYLIVYAQHAPVHGYNGKQEIRIHVKLPKDT